MLHGEPGVHLAPGPLILGRVAEGTRGNHDYVIGKHKQISMHRQLQSLKEC
jgi:hypothetical protein